MKTFKLLCTLGITLFLWNCVNENDLDNTNQEENSDNIEIDPNDPMSALNVSATFNFETNKQVSLDLEVPSFLERAVVSVYSKSGTQDSLYLGKAKFNNGQIQREYLLSSTADSLLLFTNYIGLINNVRIPIENGVAQFDYRPFYERSESNKKKVGKPTQLSFGTSSKANFTFIDTYNFQGVPDNMAFPDPIEQNLLDDINASLPESVPGGIPVSNPSFLADKETNLVVTKEADVWVTFVSEGAGYRNVLGYYTYPLGQEPNTVDDIAEHRVIFPNVSMRYSGGGLIPGDRVYLGRFPANTVISWFLVANGWTGSTVNSNSTVYYSNPDFNPESTAATRTHTVLLFDEARELTLLGFEDLRRDQATDDDFNDAVFYAKANPVEAIQISNLATIEVANDADGDGVNDELDDFPFDPDQAFNNFAPAANSTGKLAFEDLWPFQGDYDFNDLVMGYNYNLVANSQGLVTKIEGTFTVDNIGGSLANGFAFTLPIPPSAIQSVTGQVLNADYITTNSNGTEAGTGANESVIIVGGNFLDMQGETIFIEVSFASPVSAGSLGTIPFNPFLIVGGDRAKEIHLPDLPPTSKADYLGTGSDFSNATVGRYYKTETNLPWVLNIYDGFVAPPEAVPIVLQYPRFVKWANSGGTEDLDWYQQ
ncbi:MAG: LruC domain-containing protein [Bacteroidota bacterium]